MSGISLHQLIFVSYKVIPPKKKPTSFQFRNFNKINMQNLLNDASNMDWSTLYKSDSIDEQLDFFNMTINAIFEKHVPIKSISLKSKPQPWV